MGVEAFVAGKLIGAALGAASAGSAAAGAAAGAASAAAGAAAGAASAAAGAAAGAASTAAGAVTGAASTAAGTITGAASTVAGAAGKAVGTALQTAAEVTTAAATESAAAVSQIPLVGEPIVGAVKQVGTVVGKNITKVVKHVGISGRNAKAIGTIAEGTTTNEINKQILKPYNEIKYSITGLDDIKQNVKLLDDIAHGRLSKDDLTDIVVSHREEIVDAALKEVDLPELKEIKKHINVLRDLKNGKFDTENFYDVAASDLELPNRQELLQFKNVIDGQATKNEIKEFIIDNLDSEEFNALKEIDIDKVTKKELLEIVNNHKEEICSAVLSDLDTSEIEDALKGVNLLMDVKSGKVSPDRVTEQLIADIDILNNDEIDNLKKLLSGKATKQELQKMLLDYCDAPDVKQLDEYVLVLKNIANGELDKDELEDFILTHLEFDEFKTLYENEQLVMDITTGNVNEEGLKAIIADSLGVKIEGYKDSAGQEAERFYKMGIDYVNGTNGMPCNEEMASYCLNKAAALGFESVDPIIQSKEAYDLGRKYELGIGVNVDLKRALSLYKQAAGYGNINASAALQRLDYLD